MQHDHPLTRARFALQQQLTRLRSWSASDAKKGGHQQEKINERADELRDLTRLVEYTLTLERICIDQDRTLEKAKHDYYWRGQRDNATKNMAFQQLLLTRSIRQQEAIETLQRALADAGGHIFLPETSLTPAA